ncbi:MAG: lipid-A-disaccharide synthase [Salinarimonadaceae bacterium]|nr:MAG: lipid-A-disaccharide synthase [Salinarimonadaceae bacterium]
MNEDKPFRVYLVAGEESGDQLGAGLMRALRAGAGGREVVVSGVGGERMAQEGLASLFPMSDISLMGIAAVIAQLPRVVSRVYQTVADVVAQAPDVVVIIDSPDFTHAVAKRVRRRAPAIPIVNYVSPSVWAWRPGRAKAMRSYVDHVLALLPFEPAAHERLGGPPCTYVGHPLIERLDMLRPASGERRALGDGPLELLVLPGSRRSEITRLSEPFGEALGRLRDSYPGEIALTLPAVPHLADEITALTASWPLVPKIVRGEEEKFAAFRRAHAALAASGTVTLELALSGVPMVVAYRVGRLELMLRRLVTVDTIVLANLVMGEKPIREFIQEDCEPEKLAAALAQITGEGAERAAQVEAFARLDAVMSIGEESPSGRSARIVAETALLRRR